MSYFEKWKVAFALQEEMDIGRAKYQMLKEKGNSIFTMKDDSSIQFLYEEMNKDLSRLYPKGNLHFFQNKLYLTTLKNVLYIYCQLNSDVSYRQGMHDIAAIVLYTYLRQYGCNVLYTIFGPARAENSYKMPRLDQVNVFHMVQGGTAYLQHNFVMQEPPLPFDVEQYMEHDVFIMFEAIMGYMKPLYQVVGSVDHGEMEKAVVLDQCRQMQHELLRKYDPNLCHYLQVYEIIPETYAVRWIKLMLGREFYLDDAIILWDEIFQHLDSQNTSFDSTQDCGPPYLQYICVAMLVYYSKELQNKDNTECLKLLMNEGNWKVSTVVQIAKGLYNPMLLETGDTNVVKFNQGALGVVLTQAPAPFEGHLAVRGFTASSSEMKGQAEASGKIKKMDIITSINGVFASELSPDTIKEHISCVGRPIFIGFSTPSSSHDKNVVISEEPLCIKSPSFLQGEECFGTADASFYYPLLNDDGLVISRYIAGKMYLTNYRLIFSQYMSENITWQVPVFSILSTVGVDATNESQASSLFQEPTSSYQLSVQCKDVRTAKFSFTKFAEYSQIYRCLNALIYPSDIMQAFCFRFRPFITKWEPTPIFDIRSEYNRLGLMGHLQFRCMRQKKYSLCASYPQYLIVPHHMTDDDLARVAAYRSKERFPAITWIDSKTGAVIARCSQPLVGLKNARNAEDEKLVQLLCTSALAQTNFNSRYCIMDARGQLAAVGNKAMGKGTEVPANYKGSYLVFMNIDNIHSIRQSYNALSTIFVDSDADDSSNYYGRIEASGWLKHIRMIIKSSVEIAQTVQRGRSVLVHCSDGWDRTSQIVSLAQIMLDPHYRTLQGFQALIEKDWCSFGHQFSLRCGHGRADVKDDQRSHVFLLWLDCVGQLLRQRPNLYEYKESLLLYLADHLYSCKFSNFLFNTERERRAKLEQFNATNIWDDVSSNRSQYINSAYTPIAGVVYPSFLSKNIRLWKHYFGRWDFTLLPLVSYSNQSTY